MFDGDLRGDGVHIGLGLRDGDTGFEAAHGEEPVVVVIDLRRAEGEGRGDLGVVAIRHAFGQDAHDCV